MKIVDIAEYINASLSGDNHDGDVIAITHDSRRVVPGGVFVALTGANIDGNKFVDEALKRGAVAVISEQHHSTSSKIPWLQVENARKALAKAAAFIHGFPSQHLKLAGITGTNGKTTTAFLMDSIFKAAGTKSALMGTILYKIGEESIDAEFTTPESPEVQHFLRRAVDVGAKYAVMEVSSIALDMHRVDELKFQVAAFTNLTQDHLDLHHDMDSYFAAKAKLFTGVTGEAPEISIINLDDPRGVLLKNLCQRKVITYGLNGDADICIDTQLDSSFDLNGLKFTAKTPGGALNIDSVLAGKPHAYNIMCAAGISLALGLSLEVIERGINQCTGVPGRFERVGTKQDDIIVIVDYAHTPDALTNVLNTINDAVRGTSSKVITVMGCGGDRDRTKRPMMGEEASKLSDYVIATSDNPRSEDPLLILNDIRVGLNRVGKPFKLTVDRKEAIANAIDMANPGDVVLIAGKGHETYQILASGKIDFDDRLVAKDCLTQRHKETKTQRGL